jgi:hypothetical protein
MPCCAHVYLLIKNLCNNTHTAYPCDTHVILFLRVCVIVCVLEMVRGLCRTLLGDFKDDKYVKAACTSSVSPHTLVALGFIH